MIVLLGRNTYDIIALLLPSSQLTASFTGFYFNKDVS